MPSGGFLVLCFGDRLNRGQGIKLVTFLQICPPRPWRNISIPSFISHLRLYSSEKREIPSICLSRTRSVQGPKLWIELQDEWSHDTERVSPILPLHRIPKQIKVLRKISIPNRLTSRTFSLNAEYHIAQFFAVYKTLRIHCMRPFDVGIPENRPNSNSAS